MKIGSLTLLLSVVAIFSAQAGIDFTPVLTERTRAGIKFPQLNFKENGRVIMYEQPRGWAYTGSSAQIKFTPPDLTQAQAEIDQTPLPAPQNFDEPTVKALREKALASLPEGSQNVAIVSEQADPVLVNNNHSYEFIISYQAFGQEFMTGIVYVNLPDTQLRFRSVARKADFEKVHPAFRGSIFSWQWK